MDFRGTSFTADVPVIVADIACDLAVGREWFSFSFSFSFSFFTFSLTIAPRLLCEVDVLCWCRSGHQTTTAGVPAECLGRHSSSRSILAGPT